MGVSISLVDIVKFFAVKRTKKTWPEAKREKDPS